MNTSKCELNFTVIVVLQEDTIKFQLIFYSARERWKRTKDF